MNGTPHGHILMLLTWLKSNGTPYGHILMLLTWLKSKEHISGFLHNINSSVKRTAESTVIFTLDGHRSHIRRTDATDTGW